MVLLTVLAVEIFKVQPMVDVKKGQGVSTFSSETVLMTDCVVYVGRYFHVVDLQCCSSFSLRTTALVKCQAWANGNGKFAALHCGPLRRILPDVHFLDGPQQNLITNLTAKQRTNL